jgi:hypothetical protein
MHPLGPRRSGGRWSALAKLRTPRDDFGFASDGRRLFAIGGMTGERGNALSTVEVYDPGANMWGPATRLPVAVSSLRAAVLGPRLFSTGGAIDDAEVAQVWTLDVSTPSAQWVPAAPLAQARLGHGLTAASSVAATPARAANGALYAAGGLARGEPLASLERYDAQRDSWTTLAPLPAPRFNLVLVAAGRRLYAIGGSGQDRKPSVAVSVYDVETDRWSAGPDLPESLSNFGAAVVGTQLHSVLHGLHYVLNLQSPAATPARWERLAPMPTSRHGLGVLALDGVLYAAGGCSEDPQRDLAVLEAYRPDV